MDSSEGELQRLRLWQRAYGVQQPDPERRRAMGLALARYFRTLRIMRGGRAGTGPVEPIEPVEPV